MIRRPLILISSLAAIALAASGCADYVGDDLRAGDYPRHDLITFEEMASEAARGEADREPEVVDPFALDLGDCFDDLDGPPVRGFEWGRQVDRVPCDLPHRYELYARVPLGDPAVDPWPGSSMAEDEADRRCVSAFETFVGISWSESELDFVVLAPDQARWEAGDASASCALFDLGLTDLTGTAEGVER